MTTHGSPCFGCTQRNLHKFKKRCWKLHTYIKESTNTNKLCKKITKQRSWKQPLQIIQTNLLDYPKLCAHKNEATPTCKEL